MAMEFDGNNLPTEISVSRLLYGVSLYKKTNVPILVTGGDPDLNGSSEGEEMQKMLQTYFSVVPAWVEKKSSNTYFNAMNTREILGAIKVNKIYLVTHAWHMPRAALIFRKFGFTVVEAPTKFHVNKEKNMLDFFPSSTGLDQTSLIIREIIGYLFYHSCDIGRCHAEK